MVCPGVHHARVPRHHSHLHGSADHSSHCQQEGAQTHRESSWETTFILSIKFYRPRNLFIYLLSPALNVTERRWLPLGPVDRDGADRDLLDLRPSLVRGRHGPLHQPRQVTHQRVGDRSTRRKATIPWHKVT